jgi:hypothetical protein
VQILLLNDVMVLSGSLAQPVCLRRRRRLGRAAQWSRTLHSRSDARQGRHFPGVCQTAYGEMLVTRGSWASAEEEPLSAPDDLRATLAGLWP